MVAFFILSSFFIYIARTTTSWVEREKKSPSRPPPPPKKDQGCLVLISRLIFLLFLSHLAGKEDSLKTFLQKFSSSFSLFPLSSVARGPRGKGASVLSVSYNGHKESCSIIKMLDTLKGFFFHGRKVLVVFNVGPFFLQEKKSEPLQCSMPLIGGEPVKIDGF